MKTGETAAPSTRRRGAVVAALATFALHATVALAVPLPGLFRKYALAAEHYLDGRLPLERLMDFSPLYFHLSLAAERLFGRPEAVLEWLQIVLVAAAAGLLFELLARRFRPALAAAMVAVFALDRHVLVYERVLEPEVLSLFLLVAFLYFFSRDFAGEDGRGTWPAGVVAALSIATRPTLLPLFLLAPLDLWLRSAAHRRRRSLELLLPVAAVLALLALRAGMVTGDPRTPAMNPGTVFFEGNNPLSAGTSAIYPPVVLELVRHSGEIPDAAHAHYRTVARAAAGRELTIAEVNAYWAGKARAFLLAEPGRALALLRSKLTRAFHGFRWHDVVSAWRYERRLRTPAVPFALVAALALWGSLAEARRWRRSLLFYAAGGVQLGVMLVFYVSARQRMVLVPIALYFAAVALERFADRRRRALPEMALVIFLALALALPGEAARDELYQRRGHVETDRLLQEIRERSRAQPLAHHAELAVSAIAASPWWLDWLRPAYFPRDAGTLEERVARALAARPPGPYPDSAAFDRAAMELAAGRPEAALETLEPLIEGGARVYRGARTSSEPLYLAGRAHALLGQPGRAREALREALERSPGDPYVLAELVALGDEEPHRRQLYAYWSELDVELLLGRALLRHGRPGEAAELLASFSARLPELREARVELAAALGELGRIDEGASAYLDASRARLEPVVAAERIASLFRRWAALHPDRPDVRLQAAQVLHQLGHFREALDLLQGIESADPALRRAAEDERRRILRALENGPLPSHSPPGK